MGLLSVGFLTPTAFEHLYGYGDAILMEIENRLGAASDFDADGQEFFN